MSGDWMEQQKRRLDAKLMREYERVTDARPQAEWFESVDVAAWDKWARGRGRRSSGDAQT